MHNCQNWDDNTTQSLIRLFECVNRRLDEAPVSADLCSEKRYTVTSMVKNSSMGALAAVEALGTVTCLHSLRSQLVSSVL